MMRFILHGNIDAETKKVQEILDGRGIAYRLEISPEDVYRDKGLTLLTPSGRLHGLKAVEFVYGSSKGLETKTT